MLFSLQNSYCPVVVLKSPTAVLSSGLPVSRYVRKITATPVTVSYCSRSCQQVPLASLDVGSLAQSKPYGKPDGDLEDEGERSVAIPGIQVPRPRYISISKSDLLNAIVSSMFETRDKADQFIHLFKYLDTILHAEHKSILEEMRMNYDATQFIESKRIKHDDSPDLKSVLVSSEESDAVTKKPVESERTMADEALRVELVKPNCPSGVHPQLPSSSNNDETNSNLGASVYTSFQHAFLQLLHNAEFEELSARDLLLTSALTTDYLLTLPINIDWKMTSQSNAIIYRRGYTTEKQKGLLTVEKLDYLQSKLLQRIFLVIAKPLGKFGTWLIEVLGSTGKKQNMVLWAESVKLWLEKLSMSQWSDSYNEVTSSNQVVADRSVESELPMWLAAQRAVARYEGILSTSGPRERLFRKLLVWIGLSSSTQEPQFDPKSNTSGSHGESLLRPIFLPRVSLSDIWESASRKSCGNDLWKMFKSVISILLSQSTLQKI